MNHIIFISFVIILGLTLGSLRDAFKIGYYETTLRKHRIKDRVKNMPWYKLWLN